MELINLIGFILSVVAAAHHRMLGEHNMSLGFLALSSYMGWGLLGHEAPSVVTIIMLAISGVMTYSLIRDHFSK